MKRHIIIILFIIPTTLILMVSVPTTQLIFAGDKAEVQGEDLPESCEEANEDPDDISFLCDPRTCTLTELETGARITLSSC